MNASGGGLVSVGSRRRERDGQPVDDRQLRVRLQRHQRVAARSTSSAPRRTDADAGREVGHRRSRRGQQLQLDVDRHADGDGQRQRHQLRHVGHDAHDQGGERQASRSRSPTAPSSRSTGRTGPTGNAITFTSNGRLDGRSARPQRRHRPITYHGGCCSLAGRPHVRRAGQGPDVGPARRPLRGRPGRPGHRHHHASARSARSSTGAPANGDNVYGTSLPAQRAQPQGRRPRLLRRRERRGRSGLVSGTRYRVTVVDAVPHPAAPDRRGTRRRSASTAPRTSTTDRPDRPGRPRLPERPGRRLPRACRRTVQGLRRRDRDQRQRPPDHHDRPGHARLDRCPARVQQLDLPRRRLRQRGLRPRLQHR